jgi:hypothetical protein
MQIIRREGAKADGSRRDLELFLCTAPALHVRIKGDLGFGAVSAVNVT